MENDESKLEKQRIKKYLKSIEMGNFIFWTHSVISGASFAYITAFLLLQQSPDNFSSLYHVSIFFWILSFFINGFYSFFMKSMGESAGEIYYYLSNSILSTCLSFLALISPIIAVLFGLLSISWSYFIFSILVIGAIVLFFIKTEKIYSKNLEDEHNQEMERIYAELEALKSKKD